MWLIFKPEFYSRSWRCICQDIKKARWIFIVLGVIIFGICPALCIALICVKPDFILQLACGVYLFLILIASRFYLKGPISRAIAELEASRHSAGQEASGMELQPVEQQPEPAPVSRVSVSTFYFPHRTVPRDDDDDILSQIRQHNARYSHPVFDRPIAEASFIQTLEDSDESSLVPHVTHRSRHPSRSPEGESSTTPLFVTTVTGCKPPSEERD